MPRAFLILLLVFLVSTTARAEMERIATPCETGFCFHWWPKLIEIKGWHHDREHSLHYSFNAQAPDGKTFANAETVIYANAPFKPRMPETKNLQLLIQDDQNKFKSDFQGVVIGEAEPLVTGDGQKLRSFTYYPTKSGSWEQVSYGEEGEFYLVFTISSRTKKGLDEALKYYKQLINAYKS